MHFWVATVLLLSSICVNVYATNYTISAGEDYVSTLQSLQPGDVVNFLSGVTYTVSERAGFTLPGTPSQPITIQGLGSGAIIQRTDASNNIWDFSGSNFIIKNLEFIGGSRGLRMGDGNNVSNALFQDIKIHDTSATAWSFNDDGLDYNNITARRVEIYNTGTDTSECVYPGCNNGACTFRNSVFEYIFCHDTMNAESGYGSGINLKSGSYNNIVRYSVFWNVKGPGIFFYDTYNLGASNQAYGNLVVNGGDNGIQLTAGAVIESNIVINSTGAGIAGATNEVLTNSHARNITIRGNTVIGSQTDCCLRGNDWGTYQSTIIVANNAFFCENAPSGAFKITGDQTTATWLANGYNGGSAPTGASGVFTIGTETTELLNPTGYNYYPKSTSSLLNAGSSAQLPTNDFNCNARSTTSPTVGAYQYSTSSNPGWTISEAMRPTCGSGTTTGSTTTGSSTTAKSTTSTSTSGTTSSTTAKSTTSTSTSGTTSSTTAKSTTSTSGTTSSTTAKATTSTSTSGTTSSTTAKATTASTSTTSSTSGSTSTTAKPTTGTTGSSTTAKSTTSSSTSGTTSSTTAKATTSTSSTTAKVVTSSTSSTTTTAGSTSPSSSTTASTGSATTSATSTGSTTSMVATTGSNNTTTLDSSTIGDFGNTTEATTGENVSGAAGALPVFTTIILAILLC